jgi:hypothetical protein
MKHFRRMTTVVLTSAVALLIAALVFTVASFVTGPAKTPKFVLTSGTGFTITSTITAWPSCLASPTALLDPGVTRCLTYTAYNPTTVPITVTSMSIAAVTPPAGCPTSNLDLSSTTFSGSLVVPASGTNAVSVPISLLDTGSNQDSCENTTFTFVYAGTATYSEVYATTTAVTSSENQSGVTYTATVTASASSTQDPVPSSPTGTVTFSEGSTTFCTGVPLTSTGTTTSTATCGPIANGSVTAVYTNTDGNFTNSSGTGS